MTPKLSYLVCSTQRSGSNLLCQLMQFSNVAGYPEEYFAPEFYNGYATDMLEMPSFPDLFRDYLTAITDKRVTHNGVFGAKMMRNYVGDFCSRVRDDKSMSNEADNLKLLQATFPGLKFIWLKRRNKVRQAISIVRAQLRNSYISSDDQKRPAAAAVPKDHFDYARLKKLVDGYSQADREWQRFFEKGGLEPITLDYEDMVPALGTAIPGVIEALGIELPAGYQQPQPKHERQSDDLSQDWYERFHQQRQADELAALKQSLREER
ncbi:MAG: Stf0 family sulfotransferase [Planctomycetota bacterium]